MVPRCPYCNEPSIEVDGSVIYPHRPDLNKLKFFYCDNGHDPAYVGTHKTTGKPLGTLANESLRKHRSLAHKSFDRLWKETTMDRTYCYLLLSKHMGLPESETHIGMFNEEQCKEVVKFAQKEFMEIINSKVKYHAGN